MEKIKFTDVERMNATRQAPAYRGKEREELEEMNTGLKTTVYEVICGLHLAAGVFMILFVDMINDLPMLLVAIAYCFIAGTAFGIMASAGGIDDY